MNKILFILLGCFCLLMACDKNNNCVSTPTNEESICIDSLLINDSIFCIEIYEPVCGCDGFTYPNYCYAARSGITFYVKGECCN